MWLLRWAQAQEASTRVTLQTKDKVTIVGSLYLPKSANGKANAILLLHQLGKDRTSWAPLIPFLLKEKYVVFSIDLRGHGESTLFGENERSYTSFSNDDFKAMINDVREAVKFLKSHDRVKSDRIAIIGASIGANLAFQYAAEDRDVRTVILLSPGTNYRGLELLPYVRPYDKRALFIVSSEEDAYSAESSSLLQKEAQLANPVKLKIYAGRAHGTDILLAEKGLSAIIVAWLQNYLPNR